MMPQRRRPHGDQQIGIVGKAGCRRIGGAGEQHEHRGVAAGTGEDRLLVQFDDAGQHVRRNPAAIRVGHAVDL